MSKTIKHFGVLGMHWGQHKSRTPAEKDQQLIKNIGSGLGLKTTVLNPGIKGLNKIEGAAKSAIAAYKAKHSVKPETKAIMDKANAILNNPKSTKEEVDSALRAVGVDPKSGKPMRTKPVYDKDGNDISVNPITRVLRRDGQSDKAFDAELRGESRPNEIAKQKIADLKESQASRAQTVAILATAGAILVAKYVAMNSIKKSADASILAKYGPELANMLYPGRFK